LSHIELEAVRRWHFYRKAGMSVEKSLHQVLADFQNLEDLHQQTVSEAVVAQAMLAFAEKYQDHVEMFNEDAVEPDVDNLWDTWVQFEGIEPELEEILAHAYVNQRLAEIADANQAPYCISYFKPGDAVPWIADFPRSLSIETVRTAIKKFGIPMLREITSPD
jgi:hypothetical protein